MGRVGIVRLFLPFTTFALKAERDFHRYGAPTPGNMRRERKCKDAEDEKKMQGSKALFITARICDRLIGNSHPSHISGFLELHWPRKLEHSNLLKPQSEILVRLIVKTSRSVNATDNMVLSSRSE